MTSLATKVLVLRLLQIQRAALRLALQREEQAMEVDHDENIGERENEGWVEISGEASPQVMRKYLVEYDRQTDLMPLLHTAVNIENGLTNFDWELIEHGLLTGIFGRKQQIRLYLRTYTYHGEVKVEDIEKLAARIPQVNPSRTIVDLLRSEIDTLEKQVGLLSQIEIVVSFLLSIGGEFEIKEFAEGETLLR